MVPAVGGECRRVRWERSVLCESCENATAFGIDVGFGEASEFRHRGIVSKGRELVLAQLDRPQLLSLGHATTESREGHPCPGMLASSDPASLVGRIQLV